MSECLSFLFAKVCVCVCSRIFDHCSFADAPSCACVCVCVRLLPVYVRLLDILGISDHYSFYGAPKTSHHISSESSAILINVSLSSLSAPRQLGKCNPKHVVACVRVLDILVISDHYSFYISPNIYRHISSVFHNINECHLILSLSAPRQLG